MPTRRVHHLAAATAAATTALTTVLATLAAAPAAHAAGGLHLVRPGESIQQAVDAAAPVTPSSCWRAPTTAASGSPRPISPCAASAGTA
ncbi:hypothetical protein ACFQ0M_38840 [Kitasatospora aburaviensis]